MNSRLFCVDLSVCVCFNHVVCINYINLVCGVWCLHGLSVRCLRGLSTLWGLRRFEPKCVCTAAQTVGGRLGLRPSKDPNAIVLPGSTYVVCSVLLRLDSGIAKEKWGKLHWSVNPCLPPEVSSVCSWDWLHFFLKRENDDDSTNGHLRRSRAATVDTNRQMLGLGSGAPSLRGLARAVLKNVDPEVL